MPAKARSRRSQPRAAAVALSSRGQRARGGVIALLRRVAPSRRSLAVGLGIAVAAVGAYAVARETSIFAVHSLDVRGGSASVDAQVRSALAPLLGKSLVGLDGASVVRTVEALPTVVSATYDRAFPNTLRIRVVPERPVAVLRRGGSAWLLSARGRVMASIKAAAEPKLPRIWFAAKKTVSLGETLPAGEGGIAARALAVAGAFGPRIATVSYATQMLVFHLRSGLELLVGAPTQVRLKVAVAARVLAQLPSGSGFLDVSVPGRPVSGARAPVVAAGATSTRG